VPPDLEYVPLCPIPHVFPFPLPLPLPTYFGILRDPGLSQRLFAVNYYRVLVDSYNELFPISGPLLYFLPWKLAFVYP
jgi:hypothetical protein